MYNDFLEVINLERIRPNILLYLWKSMPYFTIYILMHSEFIIANANCSPSYLSVAAAWIRIAQSTVSEISHMF